MADIDTDQYQYQYRFMWDRNSEILVALIWLLLSMSDRKE